MTPDEKAELKAEIQKDFQEFLKNLKSEKTPFQILVDAGYRLFWNWSFLIGLAMGLCIYPFMMGESNRHSFRLPSMIQKVIQQVLNRDQLPTPATVSLKKLAPPNQSKMLENLLVRLEEVQTQQKSNPYLKPEAIKSAIREARATMVNVPEWELFAETFDNRINPGYSVDNVATELDTIIKELR